MRNTRRIATLGVAVIATAALFGGTAAAQASPPPGGFEGTANAEALTVSVAGQTLATSGVSALVNGAPLSRATVAEVLTPVFTLDELVAETTNGVVEQKPETCTGSDATALPGIVRLDLVCGHAKASHTDTAKSAEAQGAELILEPSASELLTTLQLAEPVQGVVDTVFEDVVNQIVEPLTGNPVGDLVDATTATVHDVLSDVLSLQSTARVVVAPAVSKVEASGNLVTSEARAQGVRIELLPVDATGATNGLLPEDLEVGEPLVTITIGDAWAKKTIDKTGENAAEAESQAALVKIEFGSNALTDALGLSDEPIEVAPGVTQCVLELSPLETCVNAAVAGVDAHGNPFADATSIQLFKGLEGGIDIATGRVTTTGAAQVAELPALEVPVELPRTGGPAVLPIIGGGLLALAAGARRLVRRHS